MMSEQAYGGTGAASGTDAKHIDDAVVGDSGVSVFPTSPKYKTALYCWGISTCLATFGLYPGVAFRANDIVEGTKASLTADTLVYSSAIPDCCCHLYRKEVVIPLESITNVNVNTNCGYDCFGLKSVEVHTAGGLTIKDQNTGQVKKIPTAKIDYLRDPEAFRKTVMQARKTLGSKCQGFASSAATGGAIAGVSYDGPPVQAVMTTNTLPEDHPVTKLRELKKMHSLGLISEQEFGESRARLMASPQFVAYKQQKLCSD
ncbi:hypothetical protein Pelo_9109 [Pelomyxa schiedti]|nr:hypothetical protein Pelo_9109 [Pelomyxa schiedti]